MKQMLFIGLFLLLLTAPALGQEGDGVDTPIVLDREPGPGMTLKVYRGTENLILLYHVSSSLYVYYTARYKDVDYRLAVHPADLRDFPTDGRALEVKVTAEETSDPDFVSPEGLRIGDTFASLRKLMEVTPEEYFFECIVLPSKWLACFKEDVFFSRSTSDLSKYDQYTITRFWR